MPDLKHSPDEHSEVDWLVIGAGAAGLASALTASLHQLDVLVVEKTDKYGGTSALSGGVLWVPDNFLMKDGDSADDTLTYLKHNIGNRVGTARLEAFVREAPRMLDAMVENDFLRVCTFEGFPDYRPETPGGVTSGGRSVEPQVFAGKKLGTDQSGLRMRSARAPGGLVGTMNELRQLAVIRSNPLTAIKAWKTLPRNLWNRLSGAGHVANGAALIAWLRHGLARQNIPLWLNTSLLAFTQAGERVSGARLLRDGREILVTARRGVVVAAGGFEHNAEMRQHFLPVDGAADYSSGAPGNTGDAIRAGLDTGAAADLMDDAWWAPTFMPPGGEPQIVIFERAKPGNIVVDSAGQRFVNEACPYNDFVKEMQEANRASASTIPAFFIFDQTYRDRYPLAGMLPGITPQKHIDSGFITQADNLTDLARRMGIDPQGLNRTVERFNHMAATGNDEDFHRGRSAFDRFSGDPNVRPNSCLGPLTRPPYFAMKLYPGDLGTKGGLLTNENAQAIRSDGTVVAGLYAAGNSSASVMGHFYPGAGGTISPAMTFGYIAANHAASPPPEQLKTPGS